MRPNRHPSTIRWDRGNVPSASPAARPSIRGPGADTTAGSVARSSVTSAVPIGWTALQLGTMRSKAEAEKAELQIPSLSRLGDEPWFGGFAWVFGLNQ